MKRLLPVICAAMLAVQSDAQTISFLLPVTPCHNDGVLVANMTGFTPPLSVTWITSGTASTSVFHTATALTDALTGYSGGEVTVNVTDGVNSATASYAGAPPFNYLLTMTDAICPAPGTGTVTASGGTAPYTYKWYNVATSAIVGTGTTTSQPAGTYGVMITDAAGCTFGSQYNTDNGIIGYTSFTATLTATPAGCTDGSVSVSAIDPTAVLPLSYAWSNGATTASISGLTMGNYSVVITDAAGCKAVDPSVAGTGLFMPPTITVAQTSSLFTTVSATATACATNTGAITVSPGGGTPPYSYVWSNGATTQSQNGIPGGEYGVTVTDANGCIAYDNGLVTSTSSLTSSATTTPSLCTSATGNATAHPSGGTAPYSIVWYTSPAYTGPTATFLMPGEYTYKVTDAAGCSFMGTARVRPINTISTSFSSVSASCSSATGSLTVMPMGGVAPYSYSWNTGSTSATLAGVAPGNYTVTITDGMGCKAKESYNVLSTSTVGVALNTIPASCILNNDGTITATVTGGTAPYSYGWSTGGTTSAISGLPAGSYWLHVTDASGCSANAYTYVGYDATNTSCYCTIQGTIFADTNGNCTQEPTEMGIPHVQVFCSGRGYTYTDANGGYSFMVPTGSYTITENNPSYYPLSSCSVNNVPVTTTAAAGCVNTVNFANAPMAGVHNLTINTSSYNPPMPGAPYSQQVTVTNDGTMMEDSVYIGYKSDGQLFAPWFTPSDAFTGGGNYFNNTATYTALAPGQSAAFFVNYMVPANLATGTNVVFRDSVADREAANYIADLTPANNTNIYTTTLAGSAMYNSAEVSPRGGGTAGYITTADSMLTYTIHFNNSGSWFVEDVTVIDTIDANLDWTSLHMIYESAPCKVTLSAAGTNHIATFSFRNIDLSPVMFGNKQSGGSFTYSIKTMPGLALGTQLRNRASIMFDQHEPETTNTTLNTITSAPVAVNNNVIAAVNSFVIFPNPASTSFSAVVNTTASGNGIMTMTDISGKTVLNKTIALQAGTQTIATGISDFAPGIYFVSIYQNGRAQTQKLAIIK